MQGNFPIDKRFQNYSWKALQKDLISGIIVGIIAIPLGMAFAIASGVKPEYGIYTTIIAGILISLFGGSKFQIGGPTGAFIPILFGIVMTYGYENLLVAGFMAGIILVLMGVFKLGSLIKYIPRPVTIGFTTGIAITIFTGQIANFWSVRNRKKRKFYSQYGGNCSATKYSQSIEYRDCYYLSHHDDYHTKAFSKGPWSFNRITIIICCCILFIPRPCGNDWHSLWGNLKLIT